MNGVDYEYFSKCDKEKYQFLYISYTYFDREKYGNIIPNEINCLTMYCFAKTDIKDIIIPSNIKFIGRSCFHQCFDLQSVILPNNLIKINSGCFIDCTSLTSILIPTTMQSLGIASFNYCENLQVINIPESIHSIGFNCFNYCTSLKSIALPSSLLILENSIFSCCFSLTKIELPTTLISIGDECFSMCKQLSTISLPSSLKSIGISCFKECRIESIEIPKSVKLIGLECFSGCTSLMSIIFQSSINEFQFQVSYNDSILYKRFGITCNNILFTQADVKIQINEMKQQQNISNHFTVPNGVVKLQNLAFLAQDDLTEIIIPTTVTSIGNSCFFFCKSLTSISMPTSLRSIGTHCFDECRDLNKLTLKLPLNESKKYPFKVTYRDYLKLKQCGISCERIIFDGYEYDSYHKEIPNDIQLILKVDDRKHLTIPTNIIQLNFNHLSNDITTITIPSSITKLCDECFKNYVKLQTITIPTTIKYIGKHLIDGCISLTNVEYDGDWNNVIVSYNDYLRYKPIGLEFNSIEYTIEDVLKHGNVIPSIIHSVHNSCYDRSNDIFHIPTHITSLDNHMFSFYDKYSKLQSITIPTSIYTIPKYCFYKCYLLTHVSLSSTIVSIKKKAFSNCISLQSIIIPTSVNLIEEYAFEYCYSLTSITLPTTITMFGEGCFKGCSQLKNDVTVPLYSI